MVLRNVDEDFLARAGRGSEMMSDEPRVRMVGTVCGLAVVVRGMWEGGEGEDGGCQ